MDAIKYQGLTAQQHPGVLDVFPVFLKEYRPRRILEIGTAEGGFTMLLRDSLDSCGLASTPILSYDISGRSSFEQLRARGIDVRVENVFAVSDSPSGLLEPLKAFIQGRGRTLVLCDGGNKIEEFRLLAAFLKPGDLIMAHDYVESRDVFEQQFKGKIWDWCEVDASSIAKSCLDNHLVPYRDDLLSPVVWVCKRKDVPAI